MENKKYNLFTAIAMVVGIVVGSGVFFKAADVLSATSGNLWLSLLAWLIGGLVMVISAYTIALIAANSKNGTDLTQMAEDTVGKRHSYGIAWYIGVIYFPLLCGVLSYVCASFTCILFNVDSVVINIILCFVYLISIYILNSISPKLAGYFQVTTTTIKVIPLITMAIIGTIFGLFNSDGYLLENLSKVSTMGGTSGFMGAVCATCFAYDGWICATSISNELDNPKKDLPKALVIGTLIVLIIYIAYYIGLAGTFPNIDFMENGQSQVLLAFSKIFRSNVFGTILYVFVIVSCVGTLNGLTIGTTRSFKAIAGTNNGPKPELFKTINRFNMNTYSVIVGFILAIIWLIVWLITYYLGLLKGAFWAIDISELVCVFMYLAYVPMYIQIMKKREDLKLFNRFIMPLLAILSVSIIMVSAVIRHQWGCLVFATIASIVLIVGMRFYKGDNNESIN